MSTNSSTPTLAPTALPAPFSVTGGRDAPEVSGVPPLLGVVDVSKSDGPGPGFFVGYVLFASLLILVTRQLFYGKWWGGNTEGESNNDNNDSNNTNNDRESAQRRVEEKSAEQRAILLSYFEAAQTELVRTFCVNYFVVLTYLCGISQFSPPLNKTQQLTADVLTKVCCDPEEESFAVADQVRQSAAERIEDDIETGDICSRNNVNTQEPLQSPPRITANQVNLPCRPEEPVTPLNCTICFEPYEIAEYVVWSANEECKHVFHRDCLVDYLCNVKSRETPCPCCRQSFCNLPEADDNVKRRRSFSPDVDAELESVEGNTEDSSQQASLFEEPDESVPASTAEPEVHVSL